MPETGGYDVMLQFQPDVMNDVLMRVLDDPLTVVLQSPLFLPKRITFPLPPQQCQTMIWWEQPTYAIEDGGTPDVVTVSVPVHGGVQAHNAIYTIDGEVRVGRQARIAFDTAGAPYLTLDDPQAGSLDLQRLRFSYAGTPEPSHTVLSGGGAYLASAFLVLLRTLAKVPFTYIMDAPRLRYPSQLSGSTGAPLPPYALALRSVGTRILKARGAAVVSIGMSLTGATCDPSAMASAFPQSSGPNALQRAMSGFLRAGAPNAALTLTASGLSYLFDQLRPLGALEGVYREAPSQRAAPTQEIRWRWDTLSVRLQPGITSLSGNFIVGGMANVIQADLTCSLDASGRLQVAARGVRIGGTSAPADAYTTGIVVASWKTLLLRLVRAGPKPEERDHHDADVPVQRFVVPETQISIEVPAHTLLIEDGSLTLAYAVPRSSLSMLGQVINRFS
jgi:hypothetical protein